MEGVCPITVMLHLLLSHVVCTLIAQSHADEVAIRLVLPFVYDGTHAVADQQHVIACLSHDILAIVDKVSLVNVMSASVPNPNVL